MKLRKQNHRTYSFFVVVFLLLVISAAIPVHANTSSMEEVALLKDTLKNQTLMKSSQVGDSTLVIRDHVPIPSNEPLYIIDGCVSSSKVVSALNPEYIESIDVLKGSSATAIYGTRGGNGVIILALKSSEQVREERTSKKIDDYLKLKGVDNRNMRYYINGKEVPAKTAFQTDIDEMEVRTGADGKQEVYIKPMLIIRGENE